MITHRMIPHVVGKWPGNIDILLRMMKAFKTAYILDVYLDLFEEYQCTTLNTRILWVDQVCATAVRHGFISQRTFDRDGRTIR